MMDLTSPFVTDDPDRVRELIKIHNDPYDAATGAHAVVICTEWDQFNVRDCNTFQVYFYQWYKIPRK